ncbi:MAG: PucR family transcriptional regulator ligand-binding domain-containing protein [Synergistaceae bacterium]|jgi:hypothetical protein|nr:PucR family transcriptional regulator ligand-binding domain-containing protein [Synergistaceae bacterium]
MPISLHTLCKYAQDTYSMRLLQGEENIQNLVTWVHIVENLQVADFINGHELIFTTGIALGTEWLLEFARNLKRKKAAGLVVNIGPYIKQVPDEVLDYCAETQFPIFTVPWHIHLVDMTYDFCHQIIRNEENAVSLSSALKNAIFCPLDENAYKPVLERRGFDLEGAFCVGLICSMSNRFDTAQEKFLEQQLQARSIRRWGEHYGIFHHEERLAIVVQGTAWRDLREILRNTYDACRRETKKFGFYAGVGPVVSGICTLPDAYKKTANAVRMAIQRSSNIPVAYEEMGVYRLLCEIKDLQPLQSFYQEKLGKLVEWDQRWGTDYLAILRCYIENDASVKRVSEIMFMHRNTINYKIRKIRELLGDLNPQNMMELLLAFHIYDFCLYSNPRPNPDFAAISTHSAI